MRDYAKKDPDICTWSTSEAIISLDLVQEYYVRKVFGEYDKRLAARWRPVIVLLVAWGTLEFLYITNFSSAAANWWASLPAEWRQYLVIGIGFAVVATLIAEFIKHFLSKLAGKITSRVSKRDRK